MLDWAIDCRRGPYAIRVPGAGVVSRPSVEIPDGGYVFGVPEIVHEGTSGAAILALGSTMPLGEKVVALLAEKGIDVTLVNPRYACGIDFDWVYSLAEENRVVATLEDGVLDGGFGSHIARILGPTNARVRGFGLPYGFPDRYEPEDLLNCCGLTERSVASEVIELLEETS